MRPRLSRIKSLVRKSRSRPADRPRELLALERLEERAMLSEIVWTNRGSNLSDRDGFEAVFGNNAAAARAVVDQAILDWESVIDSFNYRNVGQLQYSPGDYFQLQVGVQDWQTAPGDNSDTYARGGPDLYDPDEKPFLGHVTLDDNAVGLGWYFDPVPGDDLEFSIPINPFAAAAPSAMPGAPANPASRPDLYSVALHEVGHALGFSRSAELLQKRLKGDHLYRFADGSTASFEIDHAHLDDARHLDDLMNPSIGGGRRKIISDLDARILGETYGYDVNLAETHQESFIATIDPATNKVTVQGDLGTSYDDLRVDVFTGGYVIANVNGRIKRFDQSIVSSILVLGRSGNDDIRIGATATNQPLTINAGSGTNYVYLSYSAFHLDTIQGDLNVFEEGGQTNLNFHDERNAAPRSFSVDTDFVTFSGSDAVIRYRYVDPINNLYGMILRGGSGGNAFSIFNRLSSTIIRVLAGTQSDTVEVKATKGSLNIDGVGGLDRVTIGRAGIEGVREILGSVYVSNSTAFTDLIIDDSNNNFSKGNVRISDTDVSGLAPVPILFDPRGIRSLSVKVGSASGGAGNTIHVLNTPQNRANNLQVILHSGRSTDTVNVLGTTSPITVNGEGGLDTVNVGLAGRVQGIAGPLNVTNSGGHSSVNVSNFFDAVARTMILYNNGTYNVISGLGSADINVRGSELSALSIRLGNGGNTVRIHDTPAGISPTNLTTTLRTGRGNDQITVNGTTGGLALNALVGTNTITVGSAVTGLNAINAPIHISGPLGSNTLRVNDGAVATGHDYVVDLDFVHRLDKARISFIDLATLRLDAGTAQDTVDVLRTTVPVVIDGHGGGDTVNLGLNGDMGGLLGATTIQNLGASSQTLHLNNWADAAFQQVSMFIEPASGYYVAQGLAPTNVRFKNVGALEISTGNGGSNFSIDVIGRSTLTTAIITGNGNDKFNVSRYRGPLQIDSQGGVNEIVLGGPQVGLGGVRGTVTIVDGAGIESLTIIDTPNVSGRRFKISDELTRISETPDSAVYRNIAAYSRLDAYTLLAGNGGDVLQVDSTPGENGRIDGSGGVNTIDYSVYAVGSEQIFPGLVSWFQGENDFTDSVGGNHGTQVGGVGFDPGQFGQSFSFDDNYVSIPNSPNLEPTTVSVEAWVNSWVDGQNYRYLVAKGADGDTAASFALYTGETGGLFFYVYDGESTFGLSNDAGIGIWDDTWHHVVGTYDGASVRLYVDGVEVGDGTPAALNIGYGLSDSNDLYLGAYPGPSLFSFVGRIDEPSIYNRAITASEVEQLFTSGKSIPASNGVAVNLQLGTATGLMGGIANIQNVIGSAGNDILVGNGGNVLSGGAGRDLLIAGAFSSVLNGGDGDDILIAGTTDYDQNPSGLNAIMAEWTSASDYATRVANLGNALNGAPLLNATSVQSNGGGNTLSGNGGLDLFFANMDDLDTLYGDPLAEEFVGV